MRIYISTNFYVQSNHIRLKKGSLLPSQFKVDQHSCCSRNKYMIICNSHGYWFRHLKNGSNQKSKKENFLHLLEINMIMQKGIIRLKRIIKLKLIIIFQEYHHDTLACSWDILRRLVFHHAWVEFEIIASNKRETWKFQV